MQHLIPITLGVVGTLVCSFVLTIWVQRIALSRGLLDVPNARSSHGVPTPRGGGAAVVVSTLIGWSVLVALKWLPANVFVALAGGGVAVAIVGLLDDRFQLRASVRLTVHVAAALWGMFWLGGLPSLQFGSHVLSFGWAGFAIGVLGIVWVLNLFNFMDGIDGVAGSEAVFIAAGGALTAAVAGLSQGAMASALILGAACAGFLLRNWPPAKIFMGDIGSGYIGYVIAILALSAGRENTAAVLVWLLFGAAFFLDATVTLIRRLLRGERVYVAHREHAYQWLARRWQSHMRVTLLLWAVNCFWLLPWGIFAALDPARAGWALVAALIPLALLIVVAGAGREEP